MTDKYDDLFRIIQISLWGTDNLSTITNGNGTAGNLELSETIRVELRAQACEGLTSLAFQCSRKLKYVYLAQFVQMAEEQTQIVNLLKEVGIPVVIIKGTASGIYYPIPFLRSYGDIDLLVKAENYSMAIDWVKNYDYIQLGDIGPDHTAFFKNGMVFELHQNSPGMSEVKEGSFMKKYMMSGFQSIQIAEIGQPRCYFPMLPWQQNGLEIIWHFRTHLHNGVGLRHVIDWMMFVHNCLDDNAFQEYRYVLSKAGLLTLAKVVTKMCQLYLGLENSITWCNDVDKELCSELMAYIMDQGNFGQKRKDDKAAKVFSKYRTPIAFLRGMQERGLRSWIAVKKYPLLRPFAWIYVGVQEGRKYLTAEGRAKIYANYAENRYRRYLFDRLMGKNRNLKGRLIKRNRFFWSYIRNIDNM